MPEFKTIRQTASTGLISEAQLRKMVKQGIVAGFYTGNRFLVNVTALAEQLDEMSRSNIKHNEEG